MVYPEICEKCEERESDYCNAYNLSFKVFPLKRIKNKRTCMKFKPEGFAGDCGNWAIAYQRLYGGKLFYLKDENDEIAHIFVEHENNFVDVQGKWISYNFFEWYVDMMDLPEDTECAFPISEEEIFKQLKFTHEKRINFLKQKIGDKYGKS